MPTHTDTRTRKPGDGPMPDTTQNLRELYANDRITLPELEQRITAALKAGR